MDGNLDKQLKDAGLWEEGLSSEEKQRLLAFIQDSMNSAEEEAQKRNRESVQGIEQSRHAANLNEESRFPEKSLLKSAEDNDPVITYESPRCKSAPSTPSSLLNQSKFSQNNSEIAIPSTSQSEKKLSATHCKTMREIRSLFSNSSITVESASPIKVSENVNIPESDDDVSTVSDESPKKVQNANTGTGTKNIQGTGKVAYQVQLPKATSTGNSSSSKQLNMNVSDSFSLNTSAMEKAMFSSTRSANPVCYRNRRKLGRNLSNISEMADKENNRFVTINEADSRETADKENNKPATIPEVADKNNHELLTIAEPTDKGQDKLITTSGAADNDATVGPSQCISDVESPEIITCELNNNITSTSTSNQPPASAQNLTIKRGMVASFIPSSSQEVPLKSHKLLLLSEVENQAYLKAHFETEAECFKRILSLITGWQSSLKNYQRSLLRPCKWGPPICIDRQSRDGLLKRGTTLYKLSNQPKPTTVTYQSDEGVSTESDHVVSDDSDDDWDLFPKKKRAKTLGMRHRLKRNINSNVAKTLNSQVQMPNQSNVVQDGMNDVGSTSANINADNHTDDLVSSLETDGGKEESQSLLSEHPHSTNSPPDASNIKPIRKSFVITHKVGIKDLEEVRGPTVKYSRPTSPSKQSNSKSPDMFDSQTEDIPSTSTTKQTSPEAINLSEDISLCSINSSDDIGTNLGLGKPIARISIKRKSSSLTPPNLPPLKKSATEDSNSPQFPDGDFEIRPSPLKLRNVNIRKRIVTTTSKTTVRTSEVQVDEEGEPSSSTSIKHLSPGDTLAGDSLSSIEAISDVGNRVSPERDDGVACPLCQIKFSFQEIEAHASECEGPPEPLALRSRQRANREEPESKWPEVMCMESSNRTRK